MSARRLTSFIATGDSFTEGLDDPRADGTYRGWADVVAERLAGAANGHRFRYANLAVRGRRLGEVVSQQLPPALGMRPDLISFAAGGNDALHRQFDHVALAAVYDDAVARLVDTGATVLLFTPADVTGHLPARKYLLPRVRALTATVHEVAAARGAVAVDLWSDPAFTDVRLWSVDRLHLNATGHRRVAAHVLGSLGLEVDASWLAALPPPDPARWVATRRNDLRWARMHLAPWVRRRLTGRSSGDHVCPKRPTLEEIS